MGYTTYFRNTLLSDVLEWTGAVTIPSGFQPQTAATNQAKEEAEEDRTNAHKVASNDVEAAMEVGHVLKSGNDEEEKDANETQIPVNDTDDSSAKEIDPFLVDWNGPTDPENPQNWPAKKKALVVVQVMLLTTSTYMGSSIYTPGQEQIQEKFKVGHVVGTLNLSLFVLGYGLGPMIFSPLSEVASFGRNHIYMATLFMFAILQIPAALSPTIGGLVVSRFLAGLMSSPSISTGGATLGDFITPQILPVFIGCWAIGAVMAPGKFFSSSLESNWFDFGNTTN
ncbi:Flr1p [Sugiyamaella lignohabitans]|uniref:Flr1p n=1 Tax=Sugiyamaella lignohabitans TaxID=796027 RepID=A0A167DLM7_9ASCO|nr:Flr1p [Sugiyamaella lignohabitans]ANB13049.1 Flr1p [Sugiyamaella lignohabitans]